MNIWILILLLGVVLTIMGFILFIRKDTETNLIPNSTFLIGVFMPMLAGLLYAETVITQSFPNLTLLDLGAFFFIGMISGFFIALYLQQRRILESYKR